MSAKRTTKQGSRSRRKRSREPRGQVVSVDRRGPAASIQLILPLRAQLADLREAVERLATDAGLLVMGALVEEEVELRAGARYRQRSDRNATRWGKEEGYVVLGGKKIPVQRPRVRGSNGREIQLDRYCAFQEDGAMQRSVMNRVVRGVSTRDYRGTVDEVAEGYGIEKSSVSRHWKAISAARLEELQNFRLETIPLAVLMIDGVDFQGHMVVVALGIDASGKKHTLGLWQGATENTAVCRELIGNLVERGLDSLGRLLFVIDGSKAIRKAILSHFGDRALIQRCNRHKERNVLDHLPPSLHGKIRQRLRAAWDLAAYRDARRELQKIVRDLHAISPSAAASLEEGLEDTLTLHQLEVPAALRTSLRSTNPIENVFSTTQNKFCRNVKTWRSSDMVLRWAGAMLLQVQARFRRIKGHVLMPALLAKLGHLIDQNKNVG